MSHESDPRDYILDLSAVARPADGASGAADDSTRAPASASGATRPYISVLFRCCNLFQRFYLQPDGNAYAGHCPRCARPGHIAVTSVTPGSRFYIAE